MTVSNSIIKSLHEIGAIQFGEFTLKSGQSSPIYINLRKIISYPSLLRQIAQAMWQKINPQSFDVICGVPYTALPIATCIALQEDLPMVMRRKEAKNYGTKLMVEGDFDPGARCLVIEDVISTGSSILETIHDLEKADLHVSQVVALIDREQPKAQELQNYAVITLFSLSDILDQLYQDGILQQHEVDQVKQWQLAHDKIKS